MTVYDDISNPLFLISAGSLFLFSIIMIFLHYYAGRSFYKKLIEYLLILITNMVSIYIGYLSPTMSIYTIALYVIFCVIIPFSILYYILDQTWYHQIYSRTTATSNWLDKVNKSSGRDSEIMNRQKLAEENRRRELDEEI